jgi:DNA-binding transcriptional regulator LsrR (DeoR family)
MPRPRRQGTKKRSGKAASEKSESAGQKKDEGRPPLTEDNYRKEGHPAKTEDWKGMDFKELVSLACHYIAEGQPPLRIRKIMKEERSLEIEITRERVYHLLSYACAHNLLKFVPEVDTTLVYDLRKNYDRLKEVETPHTAVFEGIANQAAEVLVRILRSSRQETYHLAFAGSYTMQQTAREFARRLRGVLPEDFPRKLVIHTMVAGFAADPSVDPLSFCSYFANDPAILVDVDYEVMRAPSIVTPAEVKSLREQMQINRTLEKAKQLDLVVTSAAQFNDEHALFRKYVEENSPRTFRALQAKGCLGDMLSRPIGPNGPLGDEDVDVRALTLMDLEQLPAFIENGKRVLCVIAPCSQCLKPKTDILRAILKHKLITDLVVDSRTARELLKSLEPGNDTGRRR